MGFVISKIFAARPKKLVMTGLDAAGKTTITYKLNCEPLQEIPIFCNQTTTVKSRNVEIDVFDLGGNDKMWPLWRHYYEKSDGVVFVVDSQDRDRCESAVEELHRISLELAADKPLLIFANKQDLAGVMNLEEIRRTFHLETLKQKYWHLQPCCAVKGDGLEEGFNWIAGILQK